MEQRISNYSTYADYASIPDELRAELVDGVIISQARPSPAHQIISYEIMAQLYEHLRGKRCQVFQEIEVRFSEDKDPETALQPDITMVCDPSKITERGVLGTPDLVIEILSRTNRAHDLFWKYNRYQQEGVREYWIVDPIRQNVRACVLVDGMYTNAVYGAGDRVPVTVLKDFEIDLGLVFPPEHETQ